MSQLVDVIDICLALGPNEPIVNGQQVPVMLNFAKEFITILLNVFPNQKEVLYMAAMVKYLNCEIQSALNLVNRCLQNDKDFINAHILMAKISIYDRNFKTAHKCLENALVLDFKVQNLQNLLYICLQKLISDVIYSKIRENMSYILAKASILKYEKKYEEALTLLENSFSMFKIFLLFVSLIEYIN